MRERERGRDKAASFPSCIFISAAINSSDRHSTSARIAKRLTWYRPRVWYAQFTETGGGDHK